MNKDTQPPAGEVKFPTRMAVIERRLPHNTLIGLRTPELSNKFFVKLYEEMTKELEVLIVPGEFKHRTVGLVSQKTGKPIYRVVHERWFAIPPPEFNVERIEDSADAYVTLSVTCLAIPRRKSTKRKIELAEDYVRRAFKQATQVHEDRRIVEG
jgi:hypothetical protein